MNKITGVIADLQSSGELCIMKVKSGNDLFSVIFIDDDNNMWKIGDSLFLVFKETEVVIGRNFIGTISLQNRFDCIVTSIEKGSILTKIRLNYRDISISAITTSTSTDELELREGLKVTVFLKANELMVAKCF